MIDNSKFTTRLADYSEIKLFIQPASRPTFSRPQLDRSNLLGSAMSDKRSHQGCTRAVPSVFGNDVQAAEFDHITKCLRSNMADRDPLTPSQPEIPGSAQIHLIDSMIVLFVRTGVIGAFRQNVKPDASLG